MRLAALVLAFLPLAAPALDTRREAARIDALLAETWSRHDLPPGPPASDEVFLRRVYLDVIGRVPTVAEARAFLQDAAPDKRARLIDALLASDGHASHMFNFFADLLRITDAGGKSAVVAQAYAEWIKAQLRADRAYDAMVRDMLGTFGMAYDTGAVGYYARDENLLDNVAYTAQVFLGTQIVCAQCHDHPFDKWKMTDYYAFAGYSHGLNPNGASLDLLKLDKKARDSKLKVADLAAARDALQGVLQPLKYAGTKFDPRRQLELPHDYKYSDHKPGDVLPARPLFDPPAPLRPDETRLETVARWITDPENPRFALVIANRLWKRAFGLGLIEPVDEITDSTVASDPALMSHLTRLMKDARFSMRDFQRVIFNTAAYQRAASTTAPPPGETYFFTGPLLRRLTAEQLWDSLVTLLHGDLDAHVSAQNTDLRAYLAGIKKIADTVKARGLAGLAGIASEAAKRNEAQKAEVAALRAALKDKPAAEQLEAARAIGRRNGQMNQKNRDATLAAMLGTTDLASLNLDYKPGSAKKPGKTRPEERVKARDDRAAFIWQQAAKMFFDRAAEQPSPARPGHLLRAFGQSDRDVIENANHDSTVPLALALLNSPVVEMLAHPSSSLQKAVASSLDLPARLETVFIGLLSRRPSETERAMIRDLITTRGDLAVADLTHALLIGAEFVFVR